MKKLNSFILKDNTMQKMREMINETKNDRLERQFDFCSSDHVLFHMNECVGDRCQVISKRTCDIGEFEGTYHTHPAPFSEQPSVNDLINIVREGMGCIGSAKNNKIKCYFFDKSKGYYYTKETYEQILNVGEKEDKIVGKSNDKPELWSEIARKLENLKEKNDVINKYFKIIKV